MSIELKLRALTGPNRWAPRTVLEVRMTGSGPTSQPLRPAPTLARLDAWLRRRTLIEQKSPPLSGGNWASQMAVLIAAACRSAALDAPEFIHPDGGATLLFTAHDPTLGRLYVDVVFALCQISETGAGQKDEPLDRILEAFHGQILELGLDIPIRRVSNAAHRMGISHRRHALFNDHYLLGEGRYQLVLDATDTNHTAAMAKDTAAHKDMAAAMLRAYGLPVARQEIVTEAKDIWPAVRRIGLPAVIKPCIGAQGGGVTLDVRTEAQAAAAFDSAKKIHQEVLVESTLPGNDHRVMVIGDGVIALRREPPAVTGDGAHTIAQLVARENDRRGNVRGQLKAIEPNAETDRLLRVAGRTMSTVLAPGERQVLLMVPDSSWPRTDVSHQIHPETKSMFVDAARLIGLDVASIDFRTPDITKSWKEVGGGICEVESRSGLWSLVRADHNTVDRFVEHLVANRPLHIPQVVVLGRGDLGELEQWATALAQRMLEQRQWRSGILTSRGLTIAGHAVECNPLTVPRAHLMAVESPLIDAAIYVAAIEMCLANGLGVTRPDIVVVRDPTTDAILMAMLKQAGVEVLPWDRRNEVEAMLARYDNVPVRTGRA